MVPTDLQGSLGTAEEFHRELKNFREYAKGLVEEKKVKTIFIVMEVYVVGHLYVFRKI